MEEAKNVKTIAEATEAEDEVLHVYLEKEDAKKHLKPEKKSPFSPKVYHLRCDAAQRMPRGNRRHECRIEGEHYGNHQ